MTSSVGLPFDLQEIAVPRLLEPAADSWEQNLVVFHEWSHFYQFATTRYGLFYSLLCRVQLLLVSFVLAACSSSGRRVPLPLVKAGENGSLDDSLESDDSVGGHLRLIHLLEGYRSAIFGYEPFVEEPDDVFRGEWATVRSLLHSTFGLPKLAIWRVPGELHRSGADRYRIDDLLESHAHVLSGLWLMEAVERFELPGEITKKALDSMNENALGAYGRLPRFLAHIPTEPLARSFAYCATCDLALNPPLYDDSEKVGMLAVADRVWSPVERAWQCLSSMVAGDLPSPEPKISEYPDWVNDWQQAMKQGLGTAGNNFLPFDGDAFGVLEPVMEKATDFLEADDIPEPLPLGILETIGTFLIAEDLRESDPLLLGGACIESLDGLFRTIGGPNTRCDAEGGRRIYHRTYTGLRRLGLVSDEDLVSTSDLVAHRDIGCVEAFRKLLYMTEDELGPAAELEVFDAATPTLAEVLAFYDLTVDDFR